MKLFILVLLTGLILTGAGARRFYPPFLKNSPKKLTKAESAPIVGFASWYSEESCRREFGKKWDGRMANNEIFDENAYTAAIWNYPFGTILKVTNLDNNLSVQVVVKDRGPAKKLVKRGRIIDLSKSAFAKIADLREGLVKVKIERKTGR